MTDEMKARIAELEAENAKLKALAAARDEALEEAAKEAESWWPIFRFDTFDPDDTRRAANPNQIAERIRYLKSKESKG